MYNPYQQQNTGFNFQQTGYTGGGMNQPFSQPQATGYYNMNQQPLLLNQQTGYYQPQGLTMYNQQPFAPQGFGNSNMNVLAAQPTGLLYTQPTFQSSEPTGFQAAKANPVGGVANSGNTDLKIPNMRLSFITASDQSKFEDLFRTAVPKGEQSISGDIARDILLRSGLQPITLAEIWTLSDTNKSGTLLFPEFALSLHLCNMALKGDSIPTRLPDKWLNEVKSFVDAINFSLPDQSGKIFENTPFASLAQPANDSFDSNWMTRMNGVPNLPLQATGFPANPSGPSAGFGSNFTPIQPQKTSGLIPVQKTGQLQPLVSGGQPLMQQRTGATLPQPQQTGIQNMNGLTSSATGIQPQLTQQRTGMQQQSQFPAFQGGFAGLQQQRTGTQPMPTQLGGIQRQATGFQPQATGFQPQSTGIQPQTTGFQPQVTGFQPQTTGFQPQATGMQPQTTGFLPQTISIQNQAPGFQSQNTGFNPQAAGIQSQLASQRTGGGILQPQHTGLLGSQPTGYLQSQPTGKPGQWGFVSAPTGGIPGLNAMELHFMPSSMSSSTNLQNAMGGNLKTNVTWAITKQEKQIYDGIFSAWDPTKKGFIDGDVAISIFGKSGLSRPDLESIWNLLDSNNSGRLNKDEFAVAMHLVYRRLNGFDIPLRLPPELVPPSARYIQDSMDTLKHSIKEGPVSKQPRSNVGTKTEGERFKNNDYDVGYTSNVRHRRRNTGQGDANNTNGTHDNVNLKVEDLKKLINEKKILLSAIDSEDMDSQFSNSHMESKNLEEISSLKTEIREIQAQLDRQATDNIGIDERNTLLSKLNELTQQRMPSLLFQINQVNSDISLGKAEVAKLKLMKEDPNWKPSDDEANIIGTGPNGEITQTDRYKHRSKNLLRQRMAALTGKKLKDDSSDLDLRYKEEMSKIERNGSEQSQMINDIKSTIDDLNDSCVVFLQVKDREEVGASKWDKGDGVNEEVRKFIEELKSFSAGNVARFQRNTPSSSFSQTKSPNNGDNFRPQPKPQSLESPRDNLKQQQQTPEERSAYIKAQAEKRMNERLAKLGISRGKHVSQDSRDKNFTLEKETPVSSDVDNPASASSLSLENQKRSFAKEQEERENSKESGRSLEPADGLKKDTEKINPSAKEPSDQEEEDDGDEAYEALMREKKELETRENERKERRKKEKELRLAKLKKETEDLKRKEKTKEGESSDEEPVVSVPTYGPPGVGSLDKNVEPTPSHGSQIPPKNIETDSAASLHATASLEQSTFSKSSPDAKTESEPPGTASGPPPDNHAKEPPKTSEDVAESKSTQSAAPIPDISDNNPFMFAKNNPFFRNQPTQAEKSSNDNVNTVQPRRPAVDSNDWSDEDDASSEDEGTSRVGATHLANLLFGGMSQPVSRALEQRVENKDEQKVENEDKQKEEKYVDETKAGGDADGVSNTEVAREAIPSEPPNVLDEQQTSGTLPGNEGFDSAGVAPVDLKYPGTSSFDDTAHPASTSVQIPKDSDSEDSDSDDSFSDAIGMPNASDEVDTSASAPSVPPPPLPPVPAVSAPSAPPPPPPPIPVAPAPAVSAPSAPPPPPPAIPVAPAPAAPGPPPPPGLGMSSEEKESAPKPSGDIGALLGQIRTGTSLKKVDESQKHVADGAVVGRVL